MDLGFGKEGGSRISKRRGGREQPKPLQQPKKLAIFITQLLFVMILIKSL